jgi:hypothetical protein
MSPNKIYFILFLFAFTVIAVLIIVFQVQKNPYSKITNFDDCVKAGYKLTQGYPMSCTMPNGRSFVRQIVPERK